MHLKIFIGLLVFATLFLLIDKFDTMSGATIKEFVEMYPKKLVIQKYCADGQKILIIENDCAITAIHIGTCEVKK